MKKRTDRDNPKKEKAPILIEVDTLSFKQPR